ncbi:MAG: S8 family serine peptidase [Phycisphaerae bacterium]
MRVPCGTLGFQTGLILSVFGGSSVVAAAGGTTDNGGLHYVKLSAAAFTQASPLALQPESLSDYGPFVWVELNAADLARLQGAGIAYEERADAFVLRLGGQAFDPLVAAPNLPEGWDAANTDGPDLHLVQFAGPMRASWLTDVQAAGLQPVQYVYPHAYIVWGTSSARDAATLAPAVRWAGSFAPAYRVLPRWRHLGNEQQQFDVLMYRGADTGAVVAALRAMGARFLGRKVLNGVFEIATFVMPGSWLQAAARVPGVYSIQPEPTDGGLRGEMSDQVNVNNVDANNLAFPGYWTWLGGVGLNGAGVIIANVDGGVQDTHPDLINRIVPCTGQTCGGSATSAHGTHTAGIMAADGGSGVLDSFGFLRGLGVAPGANLVEQVYNPWFTQPGGMLLLMTDSFNNGASLSGNSWGPAGSPLGYDDDTMQVDIGIRDADPNAPGNQPFSFVLSIMNGNGGTSTQGTPDEAKNLFAIGSTKMQTSGGTQILQIDDVSSNSAHGPCLDGRKLPHMVAPGCSVDSSISGNGHGTMCGTSMASPHVSGAVAMFIEYYRGLPDFVSDPSPAMIKAAFTAVAHDLAGHLDADNQVLGHPFDNKQGWGRMNLEAVVDPAVAVRYFDAPVVLGNTGEEWVTNVSPMDPGQPMKLMLVWTDAYGHGLGGATPAWNNDLDLVVEVGANTYLGNHFGADGWSSAGGTADFRNNTEGVFLGPTAPSAVTVRVVAADINSDGIPNNADATDQDFALVCYNCALEAGFLLTATPGDITLCAPDDAVYDIAVGQIMGFSDPVTLSVAGQPSGTTATFSVNPVTPAGASVMTIGNTAAAPAGTVAMTITGTSATMTRDTSVSLTIHTVVAGQPTPLLPPDGAVDVSLRPDFTWTPATQAVEYQFELATDAGFGTIIESAAGLTDPGYTLTAVLDPLNTYYWRVRASNACGVGMDSAVFAFTTRDGLPILLVDDDDNSPNVLTTYTNTLDALGAQYDVWNTNNSDNEPDAATLAQYATIIWFTGDEFGGASGPGSAGEAALGAYLDGGGCLFLNSQDYFFDRGLTGFMTNYLGVATVSSDVGQSTVTGSGSVFGGMGSFSLSYPFTNWSDLVTPNASAELAFSGNAGNAAVNKETDAYRTIFWGFPFEAVGSAGDREALMTAVLDWCSTPLFQDCNANGIADDQDIAAGTSADCNTNAVPDECDLTSGTSQDCNTNLAPDECDIADAISEDCNTNSVPDECDLAGGTSQDCNANLAPDECDIVDGISADCNTNTVPDECDIAGGASPDDNANGQPDECELGTPAALALGARYLAVTPQPPDLTLPVALQFEGASPDFDLSCIALYVQTDGTLAATPVYQLPADWGTVTVSGEAVIPGAAYSVHCETQSGLVSVPGMATTDLWGDVDENGVPNFADVLLLVQGFQGDFSHATLEATDLEPCMPNGIVNFVDIQEGVAAFEGTGYGGMNCAALCP